MAKQTNQTVKNEPLSKEERGVSDFYQTFTSGDGPVVPDGMEDDFANQDGKGLSDYCMNEVDDTQGNVPVVPSKKR